MFIPRYITALTLFYSISLSYGNHIEDDEMDDETEASGDCMVEFNVNTRYRLVGTETEFRMFDGFPVEDLCSTLTSVEFEYVEFDPDVLTQSLEGCNKLETLHLHDVEWIGNFTSRVTLPNLKDFILYRSRGFHEFDKITLKSVLFFDKTESENWVIEDIPSLQTNITTEHFELNHKSGRLYSSLDITNDLILRNMETQFNTRILYLENIDVSVESFPNTLESLTLHDVEILGKAKLDEIFKRTANLRQLDIRNTHPNVVDMSMLPTNSLESLILSNLMIIQSKPVDFMVLSNLSITSCLVRPEVIPESVTFLEMDDSFVHAGDFNGLFEKAKNLRKIVLKRPTPSYLDISDLPFRTLNELHLESVKLVQSGPIPAFMNLTSFTCQDCDLDSIIVDNFHIIFNSVQVFNIWFRNLKLPFYDILAKMVSLTSCSRIEVSDLERDPSTSSRGRQLEFDKIENFLQVAQVPERSMSFTIEKDSSSGDWHYVDPMEAHAMTGMERK